MTTGPTTPLERALVAQLLATVLAIDGLPDEQSKLETAVNLEEDIAAAIKALSREDRAKFESIVAELADEADRRGDPRAAQLRKARDEFGLAEAP